MEALLLGAGLDWNIKWLKQRVHWDIILRNCELSGLTRRYSPLRGLTSTSCGGLWPSAEGFFWAKKELLTLFVLMLGHFWCSVVTSVMFSSNLSNFEIFF